MHLESVCLFMGHLRLLTLWIGCYAAFSDTSSRTELAPCSQKEAHAGPFPTGWFCGWHASSIAQGGCGDPVSTGAPLQISSPSTCSAETEKPGLFRTQSGGDHGVTSTSFLVWDLLREQILKGGILPGVRHQPADIFHWSQSAAVAAATNVSEAQNITEAQISSSRSPSSQRERDWQGQAGQAAQGGQGERKRQGSSALGSTSAVSYTGHRAAKTPCWRWTGGYRRRRLAGCFTGTAWRFWLLASLAGGEGTVFPNDQCQIDWKIIAQASGSSDGGSYAAPETGEGPATVLRGLGRVFEGPDGYCRAAGGQDVASFERLRYCRGAMAGPADGSYRPVIEGQWRVASRTQGHRGHGGGRRVCSPSGCRGIQISAAGRADSSRTTGIGGRLEQGKSRRPGTTRWVSDTETQRARHRDSRLGTAAPSVALSHCTACESDGAHTAWVMNLLLRHTVSGEKDFVSEWIAALLGASWQLDLCWENFGVAPSLVDPRLQPLDKASADESGDCTGTPDQASASVPGISHGKADAGNGRLAGSWVAACGDFPSSWLCTVGTQHARFPGCRVGSPPLCRDPKLLSPDAGIALHEATPCCDSYEQCGASYNPGSLNGFSGDQERNCSGRSDCEPPQQARASVTASTASQCSGPPSFKRATARVGFPEQVCGLGPCWVPPIPGP